MTATQFLSEFLQGVQLLYMDGVINSTQYSNLLDSTLPSLEEVLADAVADEREFYLDQWDAEHDFHALDDAEFDAIERSYEEVWAPSQ